ncbi:Butyryl-CoA dehydrogenase [Candidatus Syntrophocurvum alkaliphilum]|uniref:Butyryl-CoA dehydrogenase n=1 Tax=Candidatus Syntrophocurvum alkaliphilum TaxID=2293317 RepID=A0A6I6DBU6_9FIRM|nr:acyl-CoA dehydrogenase family protein [Candidatus Syntrophocurvum alkaliphilum]QGU00169.1 Butyryl-CoA dehydrogenase [Candidatus Syntrophocurvum alkaliphilum]
MWYMNEERQLMQNIAKEFVENEVKPVALEIDKKDEFPLKLFKRAGELGFLGVTFPEEFGGLGGDNTTLALIIEELSKSSPVLAVAIGAHSLLAGGMLNMLGSPEQKEKYLKPAATGEIILACGSTESAGGSNHIEHNTKAVLDGDEWVINGGKVLISNIHYANAYVVLAVTDDKVDPVTREGMSAFIIDADTPGFEVSKPEVKLGWHGSSTGTISFKNCRIPKENLLGPLNGALRAMFVSVRDEFLSCGPMGLGMAEAAYEMALNYSLEREQQGQNMYDRLQVTRHKLVKMFTEIQTLRALVYSSYALKDQGHLALAEGRMLKVKGAEVSEYVAREAIQIFGGVGTIVDTGVERFWRDAKVLAIGGASVEALNEQIGYMIRNKMV